MNGKDIFLGLRYVDEDLIEEAEYGRFSSAAQASEKNQKPKKRRKLSRTLLIAAIIACLLALAGCGAVIYLTLAGEPWDSMPHVEGADVSREDIQITVVAVSPTELLYQCDLAGFGTEEKSVLYLYDGPCTIERKTESGWEELPRKIEDAQWIAEKRLTDGHYQDWIRWEPYYGRLDAGAYRVTTRILEGQDPFTLEFEITEDMRTDKMELAEELVNREFWHVRETYGKPEYGSLDNVPEEAKKEFTRPQEENNDSFEYWKCGDDYLHLSYNGDQIMHGMMFKNGVKYRLEREWDSVKAPIAGWMPWPDMDLNRLTAWAFAVADARADRTVTRRDDGTIEKIVLRKTEKASYDVDRTFTITEEFLDTPREEIARLLEEQNTNVWLAFDWEADQKQYPALDVPFQNTSPHPIAAVADALALAEKECTAEYNMVVVYRDETAGIWKIEYQINYGHLGYQFVYLNDDGMTVRISSAGPKFG